MSGPKNAHHRRTVVVLAGVLLMVVVWSGWSPWHRQDWLLENLLVVLAVPVLWVIYHRLPFSRVSWVLIFVFLCLHELGAHYTYSEVPYEVWWRRWTGGSFNGLMGWERNNFDRVIHLAYGLLLACPVREIFLHWVKVRGFWSYFLPLDLVLSSSAFYEMIEWAAAAIFGGDLGVAYVGTQGDPWDAQKDMVLAAGGALVALAGMAVVNRRCQRDFEREWTDSLSVDGAGKGAAGD